MSEAKLTDNALEILERRYFRKDDHDIIVEDWRGLCTRVAQFVASVEELDEQELWAGKFFEQMFTLAFLPNSPTLFNAGLELGNLSGCFVLPVGDSIVEIFEAVKTAALVFASGGGCGYDFSDLRKRGSPVSRTKGVSSGPVSFIHVFNAATDIIKQGGKRRGANMGVLRIDHPDIEEFIDSKIEEGALANFNLSVAVTDKFMKKVAGIVGDDSFELYNKHTGQVDQVVSAVALFQKLVKRAWSNGEPGVVFIDTINNTHPLRALGRISGVNPCGEQPLLPYESCNLGSINLASFCNGGAEDGIDWTTLATTVSIAVRFLDNVITVNRHAIPQIEETSLRSRKIGLGIMGWADLLLKLEIMYNSDVAIHLGAKVMEFIQFHALNASCGLATLRGTFPAYDQLERLERSNTEWSEPSLAWEDLDKEIKQHGLRNGCLTTIAPTGSLSIIAGVSSGMEPNFQWEYTYHRIGKEFTEVHPMAVTYLTAGTPLPRQFVTALEIDPYWHIRMQASFQQWVDAGISKTINLPTTATKQEVGEAIITAWKLGCKGVTLYRSGSRQKEVLVAKKSQQKAVSVPQLSPRTRPRKTSGATLRIPVGDNCGHLFITVNYDDIGPCESFIVLGRGGGCISSHVEALGRLISLALRSGVDYAEIVNQLLGIRCSKIRHVEGKFIRSCADAVAHALEELITGEDTLLSVGGPQLEELTGNDNAVSFGENPECPECYNMLSREGSCLHCRFCGYSKCV